MTLYLDTSALVKLYIKEQNSELVLTAVRSETVIVISNVGYAEARSALARMRDEQRVSRDEYRQAITDLNQDWSTFAHVDVVYPLSLVAGDLAELYTLRGFDAIHLASALHSKESLGNIDFLSFDDRLNDAATEAGLALYGDEPAPTS